jgi:putative phosphoesterase
VYTYITPTRIAVISDTHLPRGERRLSAACLRELERADLILHGGDVVAESTLRELEALVPVEAVHGNMDERSLKEHLPERHVVALEGARIGMVHIPGPGPGREQRLASSFPGCDAVVYGHTHVPEVARHDGVWLLNPGSPTERRRAPTRAMIVMEVDDRRIAPRLVELP